MELGWDLPVCATCAVQYEADADRAHCPVCEDERQYVGPDGQQWTTLRELAESGHRTELREEVTGLWGVGTTPAVAIGQRALLVPGEGGNLLWDCTPYLDDDTVAAVEAHGGIAAIAVSHPHFFSTISDWSAAFDAPVWVHASDARWLGRRSGVRTWDGESAGVLPGRTLLDLGMHFPGGSVVHWPGLDGRGALCTGDIITVVADRRWASFMYSYPNLIPEHPDTIAHALGVLERFDYDSVFGGWWGKTMIGDAKTKVLRSAHRYFAHLGADPSALPPLR
ncbi:hypothetical protein FHX74_000425 [Friedmanniella endophytica]|uniref:Metallo-beta-lactamase domain-containing protein n=1 Tax=Microlunatus kandeliicorticis TaxID=1759536 RepID=A0A7W3IPG5_9ACTN|nr:MBL fold metallo-hydrolase [Microlunatus kandeliicorticis]MBA8792831.1 hypothetical protein [Microlunatus kandeliicorticis]